MGSATRNPEPTKANNNAVKRLNALGYQVTLTAAAHSLTHVTFVLARNGG
jgi:hypothetical protein